MQTELISKITNEQKDQALLSKCTKHEEDCTNFCVLLRKSELYLKLILFQKPVLVKIVGIFLKNQKSNSSFEMLTQQQQWNVREEALCREVKEQKIIFEHNLLPTMQSVTAAPLKSHKNSLLVVKSLCGVQNLRYFPEESSDL